MTDISLSGVVERPSGEVLKMSGFEDWRWKIDSPALQTSISERFGALLRKIKHRSARAWKKRPSLPVLILLAAAPLCSWRLLALDVLIPLASGECNCLMCLLLMTFPLIGTFLKPWAIFLGTCFLSQFFCSLSCYLMLDLTVAKHLEWNWFQDLQVPFSLHCLWLLFW